MKPLRIAADLELPIDFVTSTSVILAQKGSGKSYTASVEAEELLAAGQQVVVLDPTGAWWGLRAGADGTSAGFPVAVLGGDHGDIPLEAGGGEAIADAIATEHFSAIIDLTTFRKGEASRFAALFLETLYRRNRDPLHLFLDEADVFAPQKPMGDEARVLGACQDIVRRGRIRGIGCTLITQRPAVLNKDVLSQAEMLTALRMSHPRDLAAIQEWIAVHADHRQAAELIASLPSLPTGEAWWWAPMRNLLQRAKVRPRLTFDSGRTPRAGERVAAPKVLAPVDLARLGETMATAAERARESDPKALRAELLRLRRQLEERPAASPAELQELAHLRAEVALHRARWEALRDPFDQIRSAIGAVIYTSAGDEARTGPARPVAAAAVDASPPADTTGGGSANLRTHHQRTLPARPRAASAGDPSLGGGERKILTALAQHPAGRTKRQLAVLTGYAHNGGGFNNYLGSLKGKGFIDRAGDVVLITEAGEVALGDYAPLPTGRALFEYWCGQRGKAEREILRVLRAEFPEARPKAYVASKAGYQPDGGGFNNALGKLRTLDLVEGKAKLRCAPALAEGRP